ncbi:helix-turn-helix domain-containing protein [bacterium]|nr:helix-turn-helix domain-containing protein [bacterium]
MNESYFKDFANRLKERREDLDITYKKIVSETNLKKEWITCIESGNFDFATEVYIKGILRQYAAQIQIDPDEALKEYERIKEKINFIAEERYVEVKSFDANLHFSPREIIDFVINSKKDAVSGEVHGLEAEVKKKLLRERKINFAVMSSGLLLAVICLFYVFVDSSVDQSVLPDKKTAVITSTEMKAPVRKARWELAEPVLSDQQKALKGASEKRMEMDSTNKINNLKNASLKKDDILEPISVQEAALYLEHRISN